MPDWNVITRKLGQLAGRELSFVNARPVTGGCINQAAILTASGRRYFVKYHDSARIDMFAAEAEGLAELARAGVVRVPRPVGWGTAAGTAFLALEYLDLAPLRPDSQARLGAQLAALHRVTREEHGWHRDNTIGSTAQINAPAAGWTEFFRDRRLRFQLDLAARNGYGALRGPGERLLGRLDALLAGHTPPASLLHGDLWSGNAATAADGRPVIFDPAVYYGDRETDLAMTELFGGFSADFYASYRETWPLEPGYSVRRTLYNLYHVLNHLNLFGGRYLGQAQRMIRQLLVEAG